MKISIEKIAAIAIVAAARHRIAQEMADGPDRLATSVILARVELYLRGEGCKFCGHITRIGDLYSRCDEHHLELCPACGICPKMPRTMDRLKIARLRMVSYRTDRPNFKS